MQRLDEGAAYCARLPEHGKVQPTCKLSMQASSREYLARVTRTPQQSQEIAVTLAFAASRAADLQVELKALVFGSQLALRYGYVNVGHGIGGCLARSCGCGGGSLVLRVKC